MAWEIQSMERSNQLACFLQWIDISTSLEAFSASKGFLAPTGELLVTDQAGNQIARLGSESSVSGAYDIIITGGGFYHFSRDKKARRTWICKGEGKVFNLSERSTRRYFISDGIQEIAEGKKAWCTRDYAIGVSKTEDFRLVVCIFIALGVDQQGSSFIPM
jgi:hypothetical protein